MSTRFIGVWFPTTILALVLLPLGGARNPLVLNLLLLGTTLGMPFGFSLSISSRRGTASALPISARASTARSLTHQS